MKRNENSETVSQSKILDALSNKICMRPIIKAVLVDIIVMSIIMISVFVIIAINILSFDAIQIYVIGMTAGMTAALVAHCIDAYTIRYRSDSALMKIVETK